MLSDQEEETDRQTGIVLNKKDEAEYFGGGQPDSLSRRDCAG